MGLASDFCGNSCSRVKNWTHGTQTCAGRSIRSLLTGSGLNRGVTEQVCCTWQCMFCVHSSAVDDALPAPLSPPTQAQIDSALVGSCMHRICSGINTPQDNTTTITSTKCTHRRSLRTMLETGKAFAATFRAARQDQVQHPNPKWKEEMKMK